MTWGGDNWPWLTLIEGEFKGTLGVCAGELLDCKCLGNLTVEGTVEGGVIGESDGDEVVSKEYDFCSNESTLMLLLVWLG